MRVGVARIAPVHDSFHGDQQNIERRAEDTQLSTARSFTVMDIS